MKVLWVKANKILPVHSGGDIRSYNIVRELARHNEVTFLSYYGGAPDPQYETELKGHFSGAVCLCTKNGDPRTFDYLAHVHKQAPYAVSRFASSGVRRQLKWWYAERRFDVAVCDFLDAAVNFPNRLSIPTVLFQHNVESEIWRRHATTQSNPARKLMYRLEFEKMLRYERKIVRKFDHVVAVSQHDRKLMAAWVDESRITVVPTGVDLRQFRPAPSGAEVGPLVLFVGAMDWEPNVDAVGYFCREIWPQVLAKVPDARFRIVGRNPDRRVQSFASDSVEVTGRVPSVLDHLHQAAAVVVPLRIGGGTRLKIYEAMAAGKAVVSTSVGAEGLDVHHGKDVVLADDPRSFAEAVTILLREPQIRCRYESAAAELAARYDWSAIGDSFQDVLARVAVNRSPAVAQYVVTSEA